MNSMNKSRCTLSAVATSDCQYIYALGGFNGQPLNLVERFDVCFNRWELITPMINKRFMHVSVAFVT